MFWNNKGANKSPQGLRLYCSNTCDIKSNDKSEIIEQETKAKKPSLNQYHLDSLGHL